MWGAPVHPAQPHLSAAEALPPPVAAALTEVLRPSQAAFDRAECQLSVYQVPAGGKSPYLPEVYKALYVPCDGA